MTFLIPSRGGYPSASLITSALLISDPVADPQGKRDEAEYGRCRFHPGVFSLVCRSVQSIGDNRNGHRRHVHSVSSVVPNMDVVKPRIHSVFVWILQPGFANLFAT